MKASCAILTVLIVLAIMAVCVMVKFATEITVEERHRDYFPFRTHGLPKSMGIVTLSENVSTSMSSKYPFLAAITRNSSNSWVFSCFGSVISVKWIVTSAHCRSSGATHRVILYHDFIRNLTHTYPILFWRIHERFGVTGSKNNDIAVAKMNVNFYQYDLKPSIFDEGSIKKEVQVAIWKTVKTMDYKVFLTNDFEIFNVKISEPKPCFEAYRIDMMEERLICVDLTDYDDCFVHEFGPIYSSDKIVGVLSIKPKDCDVKYVVFTNVSFFSSWIRKSIQSSYV